MLGHMVILDTIVLIKQNKKLRPQHRKLHLTPLVEMSAIYTVITTINLSSEFCCLFDDILIARIGPFVESWLRLLRKVCIV
jgi:hypothetical protein